LWAAAAHGSIKRVRFLFFSLFKVDVVLLVDVAVGLGLHYEICNWDDGAHRRFELNYQLNW
jgi:hypothetical protein